MTAFTPATHKTTAPSESVTPQTQEAGAGAEGSPQPSAPSLTRIDYRVATLPSGPILAVVGSLGVCVGILAAVLIMALTS